MSLNDSNFDGMELLSDVLCGVDGTRSAYEAVRQAAALAGPDGRLTLLAATARSGSGRFEGTTLAAPRASRALEYAKRLARQAGVHSDAELASDGSVMELVLGHAHGHRLLALGAPSMSRLGHLFVGGIATRAAHELPCSLLIARRPPTGTRIDERILLASDALERSDELVDLAAQLARARDSSLLLFHAPGSESASHPTRIAAQAERLRDVLGERCTVRMQPGRAHQEIVKVAAEERASLIVLTSRRLSGLRTLGSVSERVVHDAPCSVLVVRPEDLPLVEDLDASAALLAD
ncbi:MAG TPA: universal stress protein [Solirubrobacteraceae bacterium]|nr:universal stress protein [Solirubrobacteraceae bacterium]